MPKLVHTTPCKECPFRRASAPGWLGASTPEGFLSSTLAEFHMPCHMAIDYEDPDWEEEQLPDAPLCAGSLIFLKNTCKVPRDPLLVAARGQVDADRVNVFGFGPEFLEHHNRG